MIVCLYGFKRSSFRKSLSVFLLLLLGENAAQASAESLENELVLIRTAHTFVPLEDSDALILKNATAVSMTYQVRSLELSGDSSPRRDGGAMLLRLALEKGEGLTCVKLKDPCFEKGILTKLRKLPFKSVKSLTVIGLRFSDHLTDILRLFPCLDELVITRHALPMPACVSPRVDHPDFAQIKKENAIGRLPKDVRACLGPISAYMERRSLQTFVIPEVLTRDASFTVALAAVPLRGYYLKGTVDGEGGTSGVPEILSVFGSSQVNDKIFQQNTKRTFIILS